MAKSGKTMMLSGVLVLMLIALGQAHDMTKRVMKQGNYCAELRCYHDQSGSGALASVDVSSVVTLSLDVALPTGSWQTYYILHAADQRVEELNSPQNIHDFQAVVRDDLIEYTVKLSDTKDCEASERFACFLEHDGQFDFVRAHVIRDPADSGAAGDEDLTVSGAIIEIMSRVANEMVTFDSKLNDSTAKLDGDVESLQLQMTARVGNFQQELSTRVSALEAKSKAITTEKEGELEVAATQSNDSLSATSGNLLAEVSGVETGLTTRLDNGSSKLNQRVTTLSGDVSAEISRSGSNNEKEVADVTAKLQSNVNALGSDVTSIGDTAARYVSGVKAKLDRDLSTAQSTAEAKFDEVNAKSASNLGTLEQSLTSGLNGVAGTLSASLKQTRKAQDSDVDAISATLADETANMTQSVADAVKLLGDSVTGSANTLTLAVDGTTTDLGSKLNGVQVDLEANVTSLKDQISTQEASGKSQIETASTAVVTLITQTSDSASFKSDALNTDVDTAIFNADANLALGRVSLETDVSSLSNNTLGTITDVKSDASQSLDNTDSAVTAEISEVANNITTTVDTFRSEHELSIEDKHSGTTGNIDFVETDIDAHVNNMLDTVQSEVNSFNTSTAASLKKMQEDVRGNIDSVNSEVSILDSTSSSKLKKLSQAATSDIKAADSSIVTSVNILETDTAAGIDQLAQTVGSAVSELNSQLNSSVITLETQSTSRLSSLQADAQRQLSDIENESSELRQKAGALGGEINTEKNQVAALGAKFGQLTTKLTGIDTRVDQFQRTLNAYVITDSDNFKTASGKLGEKSKDTAGLLTGVDTKIDGMNTVMQSAIATFQGSVGELGQEIQVVGTNLSNFLETNIQIVTNHLETGTKTLTDYLQPKQCVRNMNYAAVSNTKYVVISPNDENNIDYDILCDTTTDGGGWIVIQKRADNKVSFYKNWQFYKEGFGTLETNFYLGNDRIHQLTSKGKYELRIVMTYQAQVYFAEYDSFSIDNEDNKYKLQIGDYTGTAGDSLKYHNGMPFSTFDRDNDKNRRFSCAKQNIGAWWYRDCLNSNLNGQWGDLRWFLLTSVDSVESTEMMIRLKQ